MARSARYREINTARRPRYFATRIWRDFRGVRPVTSMRLAVQDDNHRASLARGLAPLSAEDDQAGACLALDSVSESIFLVDREGRIRYANRQARTLIREQESLTAVAGRLAAAEDSEAQLLLDAIRAVTRPARDPETRIVVLGSVEQRNRLLLKLKSAITPSLALVIATPYDQRRQAIFDQLSAPFGLTRAEAALAMEMLMGRSLREAAKNLEISYHTTRVQLYRMFAKVGVRRQHELVLTLSRFVG